MAADIDAFVSAFRDALRASGDAYCTEAVDNAIAAARDVAAPAPKGKNDAAPKKTADRE